MFEKSCFRTHCAKCIVEGNLADPDFVNQTLVWLYSDYQIKTEVGSKWQNNDPNVHGLKKYYRMKTE